MDSAYDAPQIKTHSRSLGHVPIIDPNPRGKAKKEQLETEAKRRKAANYTLAEDRRYNERGTVERNFSFFPGSHVPDYTACRI